MNRKSLSCAVLLPVCELAVWSLLVLIPVISVWAQFGMLHPDRGQLAGSHVLLLQLNRLAARRSGLILNLNLPGLLPGAPLSVCLTSWTRRHPSLLSMEFWHTMTMPFFCLPAWWFLGIGIDRLIARRRLQTGLLVLGSIFCLACLALVFGILTSPPIDKRDLMKFLPGSIFWTIAFAIFPLQWAMNRIAFSRAG